MKLYLQRKYKKDSKKTSPSSPILFYIRTINIHTENVFKETNRVASPLTTNYSGGLTMQQDHIIGITIRHVPLSSNVGGKKGKDKRSQLGTIGGNRVLVRRRDRSVGYER